MQSNKKLTRHVQNLWSFMASEVEEIVLILCLIECINPCSRNCARSPSSEVGDRPKNQLQSLFISYARGQLTTRCSDDIEMI